ncbi:hypothetical protein BIZ82_gp093 [Erwinia phage vB_EamM_EarlPhillipIV]|nr:hypothetical protein BIZ82_gp093 [Erwinia phage vB_EamM_EarlPhillipIV]ANZ48942.1 hypothetical protein EARLPHILLIPIV_93 [Erwinia phage vB_EamM_EarlPhillipIV]
MFSIQSFDFASVCDIIRKDGFYAKQSDGLPKNMSLLEKATEQQLTSFAIYRTGIKQELTPFMPAMNIIPSPLKKYQALVVVDRDDKTFLETMDGFKVAKVTRAPHGSVDPIMNQGTSIIINLSKHPIAFNFVSMFFTAFWAAFQENKKNAKLKRMFRK